MPPIPFHLLAAGLALGLAAPVPAAPRDAPSADPWWTAGHAAVEQRLAVVNRPKHAKNVILMVGDGMGISTITAARIFDGQRPVDGRAPASGEENSLSFETLPYTALVKTYNTDAQVGDSAGTASALNTGVKTRIGVINFGETQFAAACKTPELLPPTLAERAKARGMAVGVVTTTRITHATPAAVYGHVPNRNWEGADLAYPVADRASGCPDLAQQLVAFKGGLDVALGGGRAVFQPKDKGGKRDDGKDLIASWQARYPAGSYAADAAALRALPAAGKGPVLGLFSDEHLSFETDRDPAKQPSLTEMTRFALARLKASPKGYYLMIEGGRIDHGHHAGNAYRALSEAQQFSQAVAEVLKTVNLDDTLVLVTADHSHVMTIAGYPKRGNDIMGFIQSVKEGEASGPESPEGWALDNTGRPMTTLTYANGPALGKNQPRLAPDDKNYQQDKLYPTAGESHGGEDVALFAAGPRANLVGGVIEQNVVYHIMAEALGWR
jgi:alkaline phosphatase